jgi:3'(2'), 5'-bisphosphate nucleotidase
MSMDPAQLIDGVRAIALRAAQAILEVYGTADFTVSHKGDASPLTQADLRAHDVIVTDLAALTPGVPVLSEEAAEIPFAVRSGWSEYWLVDPLDGTKEFISRNGEFTVNIALVAAHVPILGVVHVPVSGKQYWGIPGSGAWRAASVNHSAAGATVEKIQVQTQLGAAPRVVGSRSHRGDSLDRFLANLGSHELVSVGSSLKFCLLAEGAADVYPRLGPTSEWDTAAGHAVLLGAGGNVVTLNGQALRYNAKADLLNSHFLAYASAQRNWLGLL